jgi:hypothetical protein
MTIEWDRIHLSDADRDALLDQKARDEAEEMAEEVAAAGGDGSTPAPAPAPTADSGLLDPASAPSAAADLQESPELDPAFETKVDGYYPFLFLYTVVPIFTMGMATMLLRLLPRGGDVFPSGVSSFSFCILQMWEFELQNITLLSHTNVMHTTPNVKHTNLQRIPRVRAKRRPPGICLTCILAWTLDL